MKDFEIRKTEIHNRHIEAECKFHGTILSVIINFPPKGSCDPFIEVFPVIAGITKHTIDEFAKLDERDIIAEIKGKSILDFQDMKNE